MNQQGQRILFKLLQSTNFSFIALIASIIFIQSLYRKFSEHLSSNLLSYFMHEILWNLRLYCFVVIQWDIFLQYLEYYSLLIVLNIFI